MATSEIEICNQALARIGHTDQLDGELAVNVEDLDKGTSNVALEQCRLWYPKCRDLVLRRFPWPFATIREELAQLEAEKRSDWAYAYAVPTDSLAIREVLLPGLRNPRPDQRPPHRIEARRGDPDAKGRRPVVGKVILCDQDTIEIRHTVRVDNVTAFDPDFEAAVVQRLGAALANPVIRGDVGAQRANECLQEYEYAIRIAWAAARAEENPDQEPDGSFIASRS